MDDDVLRAHDCLGFDLLLDARRPAETSMAADSHLYPRLKWAYRRFKFNYLLPVVILVLYTLLGASMFRNMELEKDEQARAVFRQSTEYAFNQVLDRMLEVHCNDVVLKVNKTSQIRHAKDALVWFMDYLNLTQVVQERSEDSPWTWVGSMFYAGQLYTTIGYGLPFAKTGAGQFASVIYIFIGIPLFLIILKEEGKLMSRGLRKLYKRLRTAREKLPETTPIRRMSQPVRAMYHLSPLSLMVEGSPAKKARQTVVEVEEPDPEKQNALNEQRVRQYSFPISLALSILGMWILFSAWFFSVWELEWGLTTSVYFFFVSISTVGLGDIIASNPDMMIVYFILILVGLALLSMCINLIQARIEEILDRLLMEHIQKIEKMAKIVANDDLNYDETTTPFEIEAANELLTKPLTAIAHPPETGLWAASRLVKGLMAGLANDMIADRLGLDESDEDTVDESPEEVEEETEVEERRSEKSVKKEEKPFRIKSLRRMGMLSMLSPQVMRTLQTLQHYQDKSNPAADFK
uniref:Ion channel n=1 Tax=Steinernema glaseri TaxID=37863 RepID=A0A1I8AJN4_9BILA